MSLYIKYGARVAAHLVVLSILIKYFGFDSSRASMWVRSELLSCYVATANFLAINIFCFLMGKNLKNVEYFLDVFLYLRFKLIFKLAYEAYIYFVSHELDKIVAASSLPFGPESTIKYTFDLADPWLESITRDAIKLHEQLQPFVLLSILIIHSINNQAPRKPLIKIDQ